MFLDNDLSAESKDDAEQRGASAMLALIAGIFPDHVVVTQRIWYLDVVVVSTRA